MSSSITLTGCEFKDVGGEASFGFRIADDYEKTYDNFGEALIKDDLELLKYAVECADEKSEAMFEFMNENEKGIEINGSWYDYEQVKDIITRLLAKLAVAKVKGRTK